MAREEKIVEISEGRDAGKKFLLKELPAMQAEKIATFAIMAAVRGGSAISPELGYSAFQTLMSMSAASLALMSPSDADYVFGEMMKCVTVVNAGPDQYGSPSDDLATPRKPMASDFEEIDTIYLLRKEVMDLHMGFLTRYARST